MQNTVSHARRLIMLCLLFAFMPLAFADDSLPDLGNPNASYLSIAQEREYADAFLQGLYQQFTVVDDPLIDSYIHDLGFRLVGSTDYTRGLHFAFLTIITPVINAMAGPNGNIAIASGLILATRNESELAGVIAHEIAHVTQHHFAASYAYSKKMTPAVIAMMLAALAVATQNPEAGGGLLTATTAGSVANTLRIQRGHESEADRIGFQILQKAGFNPRGMADFFLKLQESSRYYGNLPAFLSDHPLTMDRIADLSNRVSQFSEITSTGHLRYALIRERVRIASSEIPEKLLMYYTNKLKENNDSVKRNALIYGYGLALVEAKQFTKGQQQLHRLLKTDPNNPIYLVSLAEAYIEDKKPQQVIDLLKPALALNPDNYPMVITNAVALEKAKQYKQAIAYLREQIDELPNYPLLYVILAKAQAGDYQVANAYQSQVKALLIMGNKTAALRQLRVASRLPNLTENQRLSIQAQIKTLTPEKDKR